MSTGPVSAIAAATDFAHGLVAAALNRQLHPADSRFVLESLGDLIDELRRADRAGVPMPLALDFDEDTILYAGTPLLGPSLQARSLLRRCRERHVAQLAFLPGLGVDEANRLFDLLLLPNNVDCFGAAHCERTLAACGIRNVRVGSHEPPPHASGDAAERRALHHYQDLADCLQQSHVLAHRDLELPVEAASSLVERTISDLDEPSLLLSLSTQDNVDRFTVGHSVRVALLALQVARSLGAQRQQLVQIGTAALLHDIGKSKVPQEVLWKRGRLDPDEWHAMQQHPRLGAQILLEQHTHVDPCTVGAAFCHHMGPTGKGYPVPSLPIAPSNISCLVRVCDVFEALTAVRPYKQALSPLEAYAVMFRNEHDFHPQWLRRFTRVLGLFPAGMRVLLDDGSLAVVTAQTAHVERPRVRLLTGADGGDLVADQPRDLIIGEAHEGAVRRVMGIDMPDRHVAVPEFDPADPAAHDVRTAADACLPGAHDGDGCR